MNAIQLILAFFVLIFLFGILNLILNYISHRDGEKPVPMRMKLWLIPALSTLIIVPIALFSVLYALFLDQNLLSFSLAVLIGFLLFESLVHPLSIALLRLWLRRDASVYTKQFITVIADTCILYFISLVIPGMPIHGLLVALSIAVLYHLIEWFLMGVQTWIQHRKRTRSSM
ncbi:hypothetical protein [Paenibacillus sp. GCM10028914]|uniref:hypothetical protein n=1 Tax=Paenibacillus sp. GCM10028914 TaxID=3273416 RepID=UPI003606562A